MYALFSHTSKHFVLDLNKYLPNSRRGIIAFDTLQEMLKYLSKCEQIADNVISEIDGRGTEESLDLGYDIRLPGLQKKIAEAVSLNVIRRKEMQE